MCSATDGGRDLDGDGGVRGYIGTIWECDIIIYRLIDVRCPLTSLSEQFQLDFQGVLESALKSNDAAYLSEVTAMLDRWQVDRNSLLPEIRSLLRQRGLDTPATV